MENGQNTKQTVPGVDLFRLVTGEAQPAAQPAPPASPQDPPVQENTPATPAAPAPPAVDQSFDQQMAARLAEITGDKIKTVDDFATFYNGVQDYDTLKGRVSELEGAPKVAFANDWVKQVNDLAGSGAGLPEVMQFAKLALTDLDKISPIDAMRMQISMEYPTMEPEHIDAYLAEEYGHFQEGDEGGVKVLDESRMAPAAAAKLRMEGQKAKDYIASKRVAFEQKISQAAGASGAGTAPDEGLLKVQAEQAKASWTPTISAANPVVSFEMPADADTGREAYSFSFNPRPEVVQAARQAMLAEIAANPSAYPVNEQTMEAVNKNIEMYVQLASLDDFKRAMFLDIYNGALQTASARYSGGIPKAPTSAQGRSQQPHPTQNAAGNKNLPPISKMLGDQ